LQRHVTEQGVHGWFRLEFDADQKFLRLDRLRSSDGFDRQA